MTTYIVSYDLRKPGRNYNDLFKAIKAEEDWWHHLESTWVVVSNKTAAKLRDSLKSTMDSNDKLLVVQAGSVGAWFGFNKKGGDWLKENL